MTPIASTPPVWAVGWTTSFTSIVIGVFAVGPLPITAQTRVIIPGDASASGLHIDPYVAEWVMTFEGIDGTTRGAGRWLDTLDIVTLDGVAYVRRIQTTVNPDGRVNRQVHIVERRTMRPLRSHAVSAARVKHMEFDADTITGFISLDPEQAFFPIEAVGLPAAFDFELAGILLVAFQMTAGETVEFRSYTLEPTGMTAGVPSGFSVRTRLHSATARTVETLTVGRLGDREVVRVVVSQGASTLTFCLDRTPPYVLRLTVETAVGTTIWEMR